MRYGIGCTQKYVSIEIRLSLQDRRPTACFVKKENTQWKEELAELNDAMRASVSEEDWEDVDQLDIEQASPKITDQERVYLVGVQVKSRKTDADSFTGAPRHDVRTSYDRVCVSMAP